MAALLAGLLLPLDAVAADPLERGGRLCLHPMVLPFSGDESDERRPRILRQLEAGFREAGLSLADPEEVEALEKRVREEEGFIDPVTGIRDPTRFRAYEERLAAALRDELGCSGQLQASVVTVQAPFTNGTASWDGVTRQVSSTGRIVMQVLGGVNESGWVSAFSLWLTVTDLLGEDVAFRSAGIETPVQLAVMEDKDLVPEDLWLTDEARFDEAIRSALGPAGESLRTKGRP